MSSADLFEDGFPHGTVQGYLNGCRGSACPAGVEHGLSCKRAKQLDAGDYRYKRLTREGKTPSEIAAALAEKPHHTDKPAPDRQARHLAGLDREFRDTPVVNTSAPFTERPPEETPAMPTPKDLAKTSKPLTAAPVEETIPYETAEGVVTAVDLDGTIHREKPPAQQPQLTTDKWTAGLTRYAKTKVLSQIRDWCRTNGYPDVPTHGRIPQDALTAYDAAHGEISIDIVADTTKLHEAPAEADLAAVEAEKLTTDAIAQIFDIPAEPLADEPHPTATELAGERAREWSERMAEVEEALSDVLLPGTLTPLEPTEFDEALEQSRERIAEQFEGAAPAPTEVLRGAQRRVDEHTVTAGAGPVLEPAGERPEWAEVAISVDVERARDLAARLEAELARTEAALATVIERWWAQVAENTRLRNEMDELVEYASLALIAEQAATRAVRNANYAIAQLRRRENRKKGRR